MRFNTSGGDLPLLALVYENRWINDSVLLGDVATELLVFVADVIITFGVRISFGVKDAVVMDVAI